MRISSVQIKNFRGFEDETIPFAAHTSLVGPNGAGKSTVLAALNIFFQESSSATDVAVLAEEDFHNGNTKEPIEITVTFDELTDAAKDALSHYVRQGKLVVTAVAVFDTETRRAPVEQFGERLVFKQFSPFFVDEKNREPVDALRQRFTEVTAGLTDFPSQGTKPTKAAMTTALREYEENHEPLCQQERSSDKFYGAAKGGGKLEPFVQWIYLPAVKDASEETEEAGSTALGQLLQRTVRQKVNFDEALKQLLQKTREAYDALLSAQQTALGEISASLAKRLAAFSHPDASLAVEWIQGSDKSVSISEPRAGIKAQEGKFKGSLARFGHGLQRSFLLAILQELASLERESDDEKKAQQPTLIFACEEPELYQHPPQARHLANVLRALAEGGNQIILTTHSPYFVSGESFEEIRLIRKKQPAGKCFSRFTDYARFASRIGKATGKIPDKPPVARAKLFAALRPETSELYFCQRLVIVEGMEDRAYISGALHLDNRWDTIRRAGLHIIPADCKSGILQLLAIAQELEIPCFVSFDADGDVVKPEHRALHEKDNKALISALDAKVDVFPAATEWGDCYAIWPTRLEAEVIGALGKTDWESLCTKARQAIDPGASLKKNPVFIGEVLRIAWSENKKPQVLIDLADRLIKFAGV